jgi:hypothetical protein
VTTFGLETVDPHHPKPLNYKGSLIDFFGAE